MLMLWLHLLERVRRRARIKSGPPTLKHHMHLNITDDFPLTSTSNIEKE